MHTGVLLLVLALLGLLAVSLYVITRMRRPPARPPARDGAQTVTGPQFTTVPRPAPAGPPWQPNAPWPPAQPSPASPWEPGEWPPGRWEAETGGPGAGDGDARYRLPHGRPEHRAGAAGGPEASGRADEPPGRVVAPDRPAVGPDSPPWGPAPKPDSEPPAWAQPPDQP